MFRRKAFTHHWSAYSPTVAPVFGRKSKQHQPAQAWAKTIQSNGCLLLGITTNYY
ncbi:MAG: hypothetical protein LBP87_12325 [Planctomycetaceae bacterium]|nr:hypothetical protein [Planctomycetaceae bacterium]